MGGYTRLLLTIDESGTVQRGASVHRLMMLTFNYIDNHFELEVNHKNGIRTDNRLENLEWCTRDENAKHSSENDFLKISMKKLSNKDVLEIRDLLKTSNLKQWEIAEMYNVLELIFQQLLQEEVENIFSI